MHSTFKPLRCVFVVWCFLWMPVWSGFTAEPGKEGTLLDFNRDIKPILSGRCVACHGPDEETRESGLRLDTFEGATVGGDSGPAIEVGDSELSELILRVTADDPDQLMPPSDHGARLSEDEVDKLTRWIDSGAEYDTHWSYVPPTRPAIPAVSSPELRAQIRNPIDAFAFRSLEKKGGKPSPAADRYTLIRRLSLDLTGLPPTVADADRFMNDPAPDAYERMVDRMLASPAFAERWAAEWMDLARYADSAGYAEDLPRSIWAFRDYVIDALATNKSFAQFTVDQIAGDLLPNPTPMQLHATAFHRNTMTNSEGGTDDEEFRSAAIVDRVNTTMAVWMGTTMACAQCHTHKYDPLTQEEYFQLYAVFNNTADADRQDEGPTLPVYSVFKQLEREKLLREIQQLETDPSSGDLPRTAGQTEWEARNLKMLNARDYTKTIRISIPKRSEYLSLSEVQIFNDSKLVPIKGVASQSSTAFNGPAGIAIDGNTDGNHNGGGSVTHTAYDKAPWWKVELETPTKIDELVIWNRTDGNLHTRLNGFQVTLLDENESVLFQQQFDHALPTEHRIVCGISTELSTLLQIPEAERNNDTRRQLTLLYTKHRLQELKALGPDGSVPVMQELAKGSRKTFIHIRGNFRNQEKEPIDEGVPAAFHPLPEDSSPNRLALARWLVDPQNPLTARVTVNRFWEKIFGIGFVSTSEEFGAQGELPSHPDLLDWLAVEFVDSDWDAKHLLRLIVTSATYRQQTGVTAELLEQDPYNRLLSRGPRVRATAEMVRDQALAVSGLLSYKMFGPSVQPPRPKLNLSSAFGGSTDWTNSSGADRYRRGLYTEWRRSMPYPSMATFDMSSREVCTLNRGSTNTPLQALVTLNDPVYVEAAQSLSRLTLKNCPETTDTARATWAFRQCLIRPPTTEETQVLVSLLNRMRKQYAELPSEQAKKIATIPLGPPADDLDATMVDLAAWTVVSNVLLNLDETLQRK